MRIELSITSRWRKPNRSAKKIKKEAKGRVCGDCRYMWGACCRRFTSLQPNSEGNPLRINAPDAVACSRWEKKRLVGSDGY
jgi:hypothetical protein